MGRKTANEKNSSKGGEWTWWSVLLAVITLALFGFLTHLTGGLSTSARIRKKNQENMAARARASSIKTTPNGSSAAKQPSLASEQTPDAAPTDYQFTGFGYDGKEIFASSILAYSGVPTDSEDGGPAPKDAATFYGEGSNQASVALSNVRKGQRFIVTIAADRFIKPSRFEFTIEENEGFVEVAPNMIYDYGELSRLRQTVPFNITFTVQRGNERPKSQSETWIAHPVNDCQVVTAGYYLTKTGEIKHKPDDISYSFTGYVNENHPWVDGLLKEALATRICSSFDGYQQGERNVKLQVAAVWAALKRRGISYSNISTTTTSGSNSYQHVRFLDESIEASQANCIDGSVLMASIFRKIGLNVSIILVPRHAYVAVLNKDGDQYLFAIETTMLKSAELEKAIEHATETGPEALSKVYEKIVDDTNLRYQEINIGEARKLGIQPIPFTR